MHSIKNISERNKIDIQLRADAYIRRKRSVAPESILETEKTLNTLFWANISKKPKKIQKTKKQKTKKHWAGFILNNTRVFSNPACSVKDLLRTSLLVSPVEEKLQRFLSRRHRRARVSPGGIMARREGKNVIKSVSDRCVPEQKVSDVPSLGQCVPWTMRPLDDASLGPRVPWTMRPLYVASLTDVS
jgi:hypothetical protein